MKLLIASDIHGDIESLNILIYTAFLKEKCDKLILLGDLIYHGPRNDLPQAYDPKAVIGKLNENADKILSVRGNCDTEVDQMVLDFPILADYICLYIDGLTVYATHGHKYNVNSPLPFRKGDVLIHGHTHIPACIEFGNQNYYLNPGSITIPKGDFPKTYMIYEKKCFTVKDFEGNIIFNKDFNV